jgi:hypothetical protein
MMGCIACHTFVYPYDLNNLTIEDDLYVHTKHEVPRYLIS